MKIHTLLFTVVIIINCNYALPQKSNSEKPNANTSTDIEQIPKVPTGKIYILSAGYCKITSIEPWKESEVKKYSGKYEFGYSPESETGEWQGDGISIQLDVTSDNSKLKIVSMMSIEPYDYGSMETSTIYDGEFHKLEISELFFVKLNIMDKGKNISSTYGLYSTKENEFYEKSRDSGYDSFRLLNKVFDFHFTPQEFENNFPEFSLTDNSLESKLYKFSSSNKNTFEQYWFEVSFENDRIKIVSLTGWGSDEFYGILRDVKDEFFDLGNEYINDIYYSYYEKNNLKAKWISRDQAELIIEWK